jgi:hypothetical protein
MKTVVAYLEVLGYKFPILADNGGGGKPLDSVGVMFFSISWIIVTWS